MTKTALFLGGSILGVVAIGTLACLLPGTEFSSEQKKERKKIVDKLIEDTNKIYTDGFANMSEQIAKNLDNSVNAYK